MITCQKCGDNFKIWETVNGKKRNLKNRQYCLNCSPFGSHNTKKLNGEPTKFQKKDPKCKCGETDPSKFYGNKKQVCAKCHHKWVHQAGKEKRKRLQNIWADVAEYVVTTNTMARLICTIQIRAKKIQNLDNCEDGHGKELNKKYKIACLFVAIVMAKFMQG